MNNISNDEIRKAVREQYGKVAVAGSSGCGCSSGSCCDESVPDSKVISNVLGYSEKEVTEVPESLKKDMALFTGCMSGASSITELRNMIDSAGFGNIEIEPKDKSREFIRDWAPDSKIEDYVVSATIQAVKP